MNWLTDWDVSTLEDVLEQDVDYDTMIVEASDGVADLALQDYRDHPHRKSEVDSWYESASQAGDSATCRMIDLLRDAGVNPQEIYNEAWELRARKAVNT